MEVFRPTSSGVHTMTTHPARQRDLKNLLWALEDALQGALFPNDKWIDGWNASKAEGEVDRFYVHLWEVPG